MSGPVLLEADGIGVSFGSQDVLRSAGIRGRIGHITALLGRNGCGKTTLFRAIVGKVRADYGRVLFDGRVRLRRSLARMAAEGVMYSAQESSLSPLFRLHEHFDVFARRFGGADRIDEVIERMELGAWMGEKTIALSGGEKQRASLALALLRKPRCLLADEPFAGVAPTDRPRIHDALQALARDGCAVLLSGHDVEEIFAVADSVVWMTGGTTHELGTPDDAREHFGFRRDYLGPRRV